jgi:CheY-like chemotaxis protein
VLVVDDDAEVRGLLAAALAAEGYEVVTAPHGAAALARLGAGAPPAAIVLDLEMPVLDGWAFAARYRARPGRHAPLLIVSAAPGAAAAAARLGAAAWVGKPFDLEELLAHVARLARPEA